MRRWQAAQTGAPLKLYQAATPEPGPGQVRLRIAACGLNFADTLMLDGRYQDQPPWPVVPGLEVAGTVDALGQGVTSPSIGTRVAAQIGHGGLSEALCLPAARCMPLPATIDVASAAAFQIVYGTAHLALARRAKVQPGERLVVTGAGGGTGVACVAIGARLGAEVLAVARGPEKLSLAEAAGATHLLDADLPDLRDQILTLGGADVVIDTVGTPLWDTLFRAANPEARLLPLGFAGGGVPQIKANRLLVKNLTVIGFAWGAYRTIAPDAVTESLGQILKWMAERRLEVPIGARFPFEEADLALDRIRQRKALGKIVVTFD